MSRRRVIQIVGGVLTLIGLIDLPDQLQKWSVASSRLLLDQDAMRWTLFLVGMTVVLAAQFWPRMRRQVASHPKSQPTTQETTEERIFVDVTPAFLVSHYEGRTSVQAQDMVARYIGKWLRVSGQLGDVHSAIVSLKTSVGSNPKTAPQVYMVFEAKWRPRLEVMNLGTQLSVQGRIKEIHWGSVTLDRCELV